MCAPGVSYYKVNSSCFIIEPFTNKGRFLTIATKNHTDVNISIHMMILGWDTGIPFNYLK